MKISINHSIFLMFFLIISLSSFVFANDHKLSKNSWNDSFSKSKKILLREVYREYHKTFYCRCTFDGKRIVNNNGYIPRKDNKRAKRLEWEHVVPAHAFGQSFPAWRVGDDLCVNRKGKPFKGRNCARKVSREFRYMEADMHNLVPAVGEINGLRSNYSFAMLLGENRKFGCCDIEIEDRKVEPPENIRGDIARIYKYMDAAYPGRGIISRKNQKLFESWNHQDPVDDWECLREKRIAKIQGNHNYFVADMCEKD